MTRVTIELNREFEEALEGVAASEHKSVQDLCREVVEGFLRQRLAQARGPETDRYSAMRKMIGMVKEGPKDASIQHDCLRREAVKVFIDSGGWLSVIIESDQNQGRQIVL